MALCANCGAETMLFVDGIPLCVQCDATKESDPSERDTRSDDPPPVFEPHESREALILLYRDTARQYARKVSELASATGGLELDAYLRCLAKCEESRLLCISLHERISRSEESYGRAA